MQYAPAKKQGGLPFTIKDAKLQSRSGRITMLFDRAKGRVASSTMTVRVQGDLTIEIGGMQTEVALSQSQTITMKCYDANPLAKTK